MPPRIRQAAVLGAGVMGAQIAAHFANAGLPVVLLDVSREAARDGLARATGVKPDPFFTPDTASLIRTGGFAEDFSALAEADWIVEAIVERLDAKQALLERVEKVRRSDAIVSSNTSAIPLAAIADGRSDGFRRNWLGTHFFNPPRYLHLLELIPTDRTDSAVIETIATFADVRLGKGVVAAKDTPGFIGNRLALHGVAAVLRAVEAGEVTIEEVDAITGPALGRPKSATFRTMDIAGIDVLASVARDLASRLTDPAERDAFRLPAFVDRMLERGLLGAKAGRGFYLRQGDEILVLDPGTLEYRRRQSPRLPSLDAAKSIQSTVDRIRALYTGSDRVGAFLRSTLGPTLEYAARVAPEIAYALDDIDRAMRWGFGWEVGPLALGSGLGLPPFPGPGLGSPPSGPGLDLTPSRGQVSVLEGGRTVRKNAGASLLDVGDGVLAVEFHSKMNAIGGDTIEMLQAATREASRNFRAVLVGNDAPNFSAGANLVLLLLEAQDGNWDEVDMMVRAFQRMTMALKHAEVPVIVAPSGLALGGACEIALHATRVHAAAETYIGLVEVGVGLIPAGGGTKEMLARAVEGLRAHADLLPPVQKVFETIGFARVSTSGPDARRLGYLRDADEVTMNRDRLSLDAKAHALRLADEGYSPALPRSSVRVGGPDVRAALDLGVHLAWRAGRISDHDALIGRKLAWVLTGGNVAHRTTLTEQQLLDLEREAFLSLCGERKTQERIAHTLKTGKPLRN